MAMETGWIAAFAHPNHLPSARLRFSFGGFLADLRKRWAGERQFQPSNEEKRE
jgi:hypothetical protein